VNVSPALESKIMKLHSRMEETVVQGRRRLLTTALVMGGLLLGASGYLWYLYSKIAEFADARTVVELAAAQIEPQLNAEASRFGDTLEAQAPVVLDQAEKAVLAAPPQIAREIQNYTSTFVDKQLVSLESQAYDVVSKTLEGAITKARDDGIDLSDEKQLDALVDSAAPTMRDALKKAVDDLYVEYTAGAENVGSYIEQLAEAGADKQLVSLESQAYDVVNKTLEGAIAKAREDGIDLSDEKQLDALVDSAAPTMRDALKKAVDDLYVEYTAGAENVGSYIEQLAEAGADKQLTPLQQSQREILLTGLALIKKIEADPKRAPLQKVLEGRP
jgi:wobble nucleotide-excising tRNase